MQRLLTRREAAEVLSKKESWLRYAERLKLIPFVKVGQQIRYRLEDLALWIDAHRVPAVDSNNPEGVSR